MGHVIQNFAPLASTPLRRDVLTIAEAGYVAINTHAVLSKKIRVENDELHVDDATYPLTNRRLFFVGIGKCAFDAAVSIEHLCGEHLTRGIALDVSTTPPTGLTKIETLTGTHPLPSEANVHATKRILTLLTDCCEEDLVLMLISGGGSTLICSPTPPMTSLDEAELFIALTKGGATIQELNTVRKHISKARGGGLAKAACGAEIVALIFSDVPGNDIEYISSGPTVRDNSTAADAEAILATYGINPPASTVFIETPKEEQYFTRITNTLFLSNNDALRAMERGATHLGYAVTIVDDQITGEASVIGQSIVRTLHQALPKTVLLYAGESTVTFDTDGPSSEGGRNQEVALAALALIRDDELVLPFASDGHDNTDHAGAIADAVTLAHAHKHGLSIDESLAGHCSYTFFKTTADALHTGYTGSNVSDLIIAIKN